MIQSSYVVSVLEMNICPPAPDVSLTSTPEICSSRGMFAPPLPPKKNTGRTFAPLQKYM